MESKELKVAGPLRSWLVLCAGIGASVAGCHAPTDPVASAELKARDGTVAARPDTIEPAEEFRWGDWFRVPPAAEASSVQEELRHARELAEGGRIEEAIEVLSDELTRTPESAALLGARGALYVSLGFHRAAERDFEEATRLAPECGASWFALGRVRLLLCLPRASLDALATSERLGHESPELELATARAFRRMRFHHEAALRYARALRELEDPDPEVLVEVLSLADGPDGASRASLVRAHACYEVPTDGPPRNLIEEVRGLGPRAAAARLADLDVERHELRRWADVALLALRLDATEGGDLMASRQQPD